MHIETGIDIVAVDRITSAIQRWGSRFSDRVFTKEELAYASGTSITFQHLAARFAAKEAVYKAVGGGTQEGIPWTEIEIVSEPSGKPTVQLSGTMKDTQKAKGITGIAVSMSHTATHAIAHVITF